MSKKFALGFVSTTLFNFVSITLLLFLSLDYFDNQRVATFVAHAIGLLLSMLFTLDIWWSRISKELDKTIQVFQRVQFIVIATISSFIAWLSIATLSLVKTMTNIQVILLNWLILAAIALAKYLLLAKVIVK